MAVRIGDRFKVDGKGKPETWEVESMDAKERVSLIVTRGSVTQKTRKREDLVTLMVWAQNGRRMEKGTGNALRRL